VRIKLKIHRPLDGRAELKTGEITGGKALVDTHWTPPKSARAVGKKKPGLSNESLESGKNEMGSQSSRGNLPY